MNIVYKNSTKYYISRCLKVDSLKKMDGTGAQIIYIIDPSPVSKDIIIPLRNLITPSSDHDWITRQNKADIPYTSSIDFISHTKSERYYPTGKQPIDIINYKIHRDSYNKLLTLLNNVN